MYRSFEDLEVWKRGCIAKGSAAELRTQIYIAEKIEILTPILTRPMITETKEISAMLQGLINSKKPK